jgi:hypothetical protein
MVIFPYSATVQNNNDRTSSGGTATSGGSGMYPGGEGQKVRDAYDAKQGKK